ncbi:MAG: hypothetical protein DSY58_05530 [Desulfobulbus sp.]|nr:MAG: hypothetical protein DSY58_05530 [Desulfobulbus sp.]
MSSTENKKKLCLLGDNLNSVLSRRQWGSQLHLVPLTRDWAKIVGNETAQHSLPAYFRRKVLWVYVHNSLWMQQMQMAKPELLEKINTFLQDKLQVEDVRWMIQPAHLIDAPETHYVSPEIQVNKDQEQKLYAMAESIPDPVTREAFCTMWRQLTSNADKKNH